MEELRVRPMTADEFGAFRSRLIRDFAAGQVRAGNYADGDAGERAAGQTDGLLPAGVDTSGMLLLTAETAGGDLVGNVWVALQGPDSADGWIFDIEVVPEQRGQGYGRALLAAAERETARHGVPAIGLNVFGANAVARGLYESSGYEITTMQMRKKLNERPG